MVNLESFNKEELENAILLEIDALEAQPSFNCKFGITTEIIFRKTKIPQESINASIKNLISENLLEASLQEDSICYQFCKCTSKATNMFSSMEKRPLHEIALLVLKKVYDWYVRNDYQKDTQENSFYLSMALGINNHEKVKDAVKFLIDRGLLRKWVILRDYISFCITIEGVNFMENSKTREEKITPIIIRGNNSGNISINSQNITQSIHQNNLSKAFDELHKLIIKKTDKEEKQDLLDDLETAKELAKTEQPKISLIKRLLNNIGRIPALCTAVNSVIDLINNLPK